VSRRLSVDELLALLGGDRELYDDLVGAGVCHPGDDGISAEEAEAARIAQVLVRDLDVNWPGVEVALALRAQLLALRRQIAELLSETDDTRL
jgi:hypothetical protein